MEWIYLALAILFEVCGTTSMKLSTGLTKWGPAAAMLICYLLSFGLLAFALAKIEIGVAYAIWSGLGTVFIACIGILYFGETASMIKFISIGLIVSGVVGLNLAGH